MNVNIIIQARSTSKRFPNKMMANLAGKPVIKRVYEGCCEAVNYKPKIYQIRIYMCLPYGDPLIVWCIKENIPYYLGPENDVIDRINGAIHSLLNEPKDVLVRITGDCPLIPINIIRTGIDDLSKYDYVSNTISRTFPDGYDFQGCTIKAWNEFFQNQNEDREHPFKTFDTNQTERIRFESLGFSWAQMINIQCINQLKLSIDTPEDLKRAEKFLASQNSRQ